MTDQAYDERDDEREARDAARYPTERDEEGKPYDSERRRVDKEEPDSLPDSSPV
jgi:hypothetical protein